ncbi:GAF and ANTAR domain-containing protein [Galbitalea sp. SE-J8]|uniref:GAF and ANTAR domain-containing protein n=1 Tax=Galbitalea sp. SE-J8 TaxID=3054952 RepID=UPI00259D124B|nr:GAF and ANTAR domain-containing protein [Galbitalea sp. SE-J8]MDM4763423.1 GAF and ANTAR domain-containing protein [Galbitalea sp. SE-J8]
MTAHTREGLLVETFVSLADSLVAGYGVVDLLQALVERSVELFDATAAGIVLFNAAHRLEVIASTSERSQFVDLMQLRADEGPCYLAATTGAPVSVGDLDAVAEAWPAFADAARRASFVSVHSFPLRLRDATLGSLNLFRDRPGGLNEPDAVAAQALADVATIGIIHERTLREMDRTREQLQRALDSRIVIEQAKGYLAHTAGIGLDEAFARIRQHARSTRTRIGEVATAVLEARLSL